WHTCLALPLAPARPELGVSRSAVAVQRILPDATEAADARQVLPCRATPLSLRNSFRGCLGGVEAEPGVRLRYNGRQKGAPRGGGRMSVAAIPTSSEQRFRLSLVSGSARPDVEARSAVCRSTWQVKRPWTWTEQQ